MLLQRLDKSHENSIIIFFNFLMKVFHNFMDTENYFGEKSYEMNKVYLQIHKWLKFFIFISTIIFFGCIHSLE